MNLDELSMDHYSNKLFGFERKNDRSCPYNQAWDVAWNVCVDYEEEGNLMEQSKILIKRWRSAMQETQVVWIDLRCKDQR